LTAFGDIFSQLTRNPHS